VSSYRYEGSDPLLILGRICFPEDGEDPTLLWPRLLGGMLAVQESYFFYRMVLWSDLYATLRDRWCISCVRRQRQKQQQQQLQRAGTPSPASPPAGGGGGGQGGSSRSPVARGATGAALFDIGGSTAGTIRGSAAAAAAAAAPAATTAVANTPTVLAANNEQANPIV
jgi:hypothetical protein